MTTTEKYGGRIMDELIDYAPYTGAVYAEDTTFSRSAVPEKFLNSLLNARRE